MELAPGVAVDDADGVAAGVDEPSSSTARNRSWAVVSTLLISCCEPWPGAVTWMSVLPSCWTLTPVLPEALTRSLMMATAVFMSSWGGACPFWVTARSVAWVPLDRSSPRPTLKSWCHLPGLPMLEPTMPTSISTTSTNKAASARPGFEPLFLGGATCPVVPQSIPTEPSRRPS